MALIQTQNQDLIETRNIGYVALSRNASEANGFHRLTARYPTGNEDNEILLFEGTLEQCQSVVEEISTVWYKNEIFHIPETIPLTIAQEAGIWESLWSDKNKDIHIYINTHDAVVIRPKDRKASRAFYLHYSGDPFAKNAITVIKDSAESFMEYLAELGLSKTQLEAVKKIITDLS